MLFAETSFLFSLYGNDLNTPHALAVTKNYSTALVTTVLGQFELENAVRLAVFRKVYSAEFGMQALSAVHSDIELGKICLAKISLDAVVKEARRLSNSYTLEGGYRSFDVLHVAGALIGGASHFLSFDNQQQELAIAEGLNLAD